VNGATLVDHWRPISGAAFEFQDAARHQIITPPVLVDPASGAPPGIKSPIDPAPGTALVDNEGRPHIAHPGIIAGDHRQTDPRQQCLARPLFTACGYAGSAPSRQLSGRSGHSIQQPACRSNSPGIQKPSRKGAEDSSWLIERF
jgi:hypothetical protein